MQFFRDFVVNIPQAEQGKVPEIAVNLGIKTRQKPLLVKKSGVSKGAKKLTGG